MIKKDKRTLEEKIKDYRENQINLWTNLKPFDGDDEKIPSLPVADGKWFTKELYDEYVIPNLIRCGAIPKCHLKIGQWYKGDTRNASQAVWNGKTFDHERFKMGFWFKDDVNHFEDDNGYALFVPLKEIPTPTNLHVKF